MGRSLPMHYTLDSILECIFLFLELTLQEETHVYINLHQFAKFAYIICAIFVFVSQLF